MKLAQGFLCSLLFGTMAQANEINLSWQWQSADGQQKHLQLTADERTFSASRHEMTQLDTALNFPLETLYSYISPRLYNSINQINQHSPETATKFRNPNRPLPCTTAASNPPSSGRPTGNIRRTPSTRCGSSPACTRPIRSCPACAPTTPSCSISSRRPQTPGAAVFGQGSRHQRHPAAGVAERHPHPARADGPLRSAPQALQDNKADSDEKALLMASLLAELAPQYSLSIIYPNISIGSVSPAWLAITADSGLEGDTLVIGNQRHVLLTGSPLLAQQMTMAQIPLISEPLY